MYKQLIAHIKCPGRSLKTMLKLLNHRLYTIYITNTIYNGWRHEIVSDKGAFPTVLLLHKITELHESTLYSLQY